MPDCGLDLSVAERREVVLSEDAHAAAGRDVRQVLADAPCGGVRDSQAVADLARRDILSEVGVARGSVRLLHPFLLSIGSARSCIAGTSCVARMTILGSGRPAFAATVFAQVAISYGKTGRIVCSGCAAWGESVSWVVLCRCWRALSAGNWPHPADCALRAPCCWWELFAGRFRRMPRGNVRRGPGRCGRRGKEEGHRQV